MGNCNNEPVSGITKTNKNPNSTISKPVPIDNNNQSTANSRIRIDDDMKNAFSVLSCPIENLTIVDIINDLADKSPQLVLRYPEPKWKKVDYK